MKDKVNAIPFIGEIIKEELNKQGKTTVWLAEKLGCHRTNIYQGIRQSHYRYGYALPYLPVAEHRFV